VAVEIAHPLTTPHGLNFPDDGNDHMPFVQSILGLREVAVLAQAPEDAPHARLIERLRDVAAANDWSAHVVATLALVLAAGQSSGRRGRVA
jgi:hypothetical protein